MLRLLDGHAHGEVGDHAAQAVVAVHEGLGGVVANFAMGGVVANFAMGVAIEKAKQSGVGWVTVRASNHFGIAGHYSRQALDHGMLGMAFTNGSPYVSPTRACTQTFSTLPLSLAAPGEDGDSMVLDMATA